MVWFVVVKNTHTSPFCRRDSSVLWMQIKFVCQRDSHLNIQIYCHKSKITCLTAAQYIPCCIAEQKSDWKRHVKKMLAKTFAVFTLNTNVNQHGQQLHSSPENSWKDVHSYMIHKKQVGQAGQWLLWVSYLLFKKTWDLPSFQYITT